MGKHLLHLPDIRPVDDQTSDSVSKIIRRPSACCDRHLMSPVQKFPHQMFSEKSRSAQH